MASLNGTPIINDESPRWDLIHPPGMGRGLELPPHGTRSYEGVAEPFPDSLLIPRSDWQGMIKEREERKATIRDLCTQAGLPCKNQAQTNFCWANAPTYLMEVNRVVQNQEKVILSPASVACPINGFRNEGGWGKQALQQIVTAGAVPVSQWPANAIDQRYYTSDNKATALRYRADEWWVLEPGNLDQWISCLLRNIPVAAGLSWWGHEVSYTDPRWIDGEVATEYRNSWGMSYGDQGYAILQGQKMYPDDAVAQRTALAA